MEQWKQIVDFPNYEVSNMGNIRNRKTKRVLKPFLNYFGYLMIGLSIKGKTYSKLIHRLVAKAFISNPDNKPTVDHINQNKWDNRAENLRWQTQKEQLNNKDQDYKKYHLGQKAKEYMKQWRDKNIEYRKEYRKNYYLENRKKQK